MTLAHSSGNERLIDAAAARRGFSITELLVVVGIIVLLIGILLVAMRSVRSRALQSRTLTTMRGLGQACDTFQLEHGFYPGAVPEESLARNPQISGNPLISGTENALLSLMGGSVSRDDVGTQSFQDNYPTSGNPAWVEYSFDGGAYDMKVEFFTDSGSQPVTPSRMGNGPMIGGVAYSPYFTPPDNDREFGFVGGQVDEGAAASDAKLPDVLDAWGQPVAYVRQVRTVGQLAGDVNSRPQFLPDVMNPYLNSTSLGRFGQDQVAESLFNDSDFSGDDRYSLFAQIVRHPAFGAPDEPQSSSARGAYVLISPGPDGVFFSRHQAPDQTNLTEILDNPALVEEFDDIIYFGGG